MPTIRMTLTALSALALFAGCGAAVDGEGNYEAIEFEDIGQAAGNCGDTTDQYLAAFAVSVAKEMFRLETSTDFKIQNGKLQLTTSGANRCLNGCGNVNGLLDLQDHGGHDISANAWKNALTSNWQTQKNWDNNNSVTDHVLAMRNIHEVGCGLDYQFRPETEAQNDTSDQRIYMGHSYLCLAQQSGSNNVRQEDCMNQNSERREWSMDLKSDGTYRIKNDQTGKCIGVKNGSSSNGANIETMNCSGAKTKWYLEHVGGKERLKNKDTGKCLDVQNVSYAVNGNVHQWSCSGGKNQDILRGSSSDNNLISNMGQLENRLKFAGGNGNPALNFDVSGKKIEFDPLGGMNGGGGGGSGSCIDLGSGTVYYDPTSSSDGECCRSNGVNYTLHEQSWNPTIYYCY